MDSLAYKSDPEQPEAMSPDIERRLGYVASELASLADYFRDSKSLDITDTAVINANTGGMVDLAAALARSAINRSSFGVIQFPDKYIIDHNGLNNEGFAELHVEYVPLIPTQAAPPPDTGTDWGCLFFAFLAAAILLAVVGLLGIGGYTVWQWVFG